MHFIGGERVKVKVVKVKEKDMKSLWRLSPIVSKPSDSSCFSFIKKRYLWLNGMIIGYRVAIEKPCDVSFDADELDLSCFSEEAKKNEA